MNTVLNFPKEPLNKVIRQGSLWRCKKCGSSASKAGFLGLIGERFCDNKICKNSKKRFKKL